MKIRSMMPTILAAAGGVASTRVPRPDPQQLHAGLLAFRNDATAGFGAVVWEGREWIQRYPSVALMVAAAAAVVLLNILLWQVLGRRTAAPSGHDLRDARVYEAMRLSSQGQRGVDVARQTALSRDAVELLLQVKARADGIAESGRSFRPGRFQQAGA